MHDMNRDTLRDRLPDLLHGRLAATDAAELQRAIHADAELSAEYAVLRSVLAAHRAAPAIDISRIVSALPPASSMTAPEVDELAARREAKRPWISTRFARAAALLAMVGGGTMFSVISNRSQIDPLPTAVAPVESLATRGAAMELGLGASTDDLSVEQLRALEADIRSLDGLPSVEPESGTDLFDVESAS